jgi:hypothetical protein
VLEFAAVNTVEFKDKSSGKSIWIIEPLRMGYWDPIKNSNEYVQISSVWLAV